MIELNFEFTKSELLEAQRRMNPAVRFLAILMVLVALFFLWLGYRTVFAIGSPTGAPVSKTTQAADLVAGMLPFAVYVAINIPVFLALRKRLRRQRANPLLAGPRRMIFDDAGIRSVHALAETFYRWEVIEKVFVTKQLYLLRAWSIVLIVPKRAIPPNQLEQFEHLVRSRMMERTRGFPVLTSPPPLPAANIQQGQV